MISSFSKKKMSQLIELRSNKGRDKYGLYFGETHKIFEFVYETKPLIIDSIYCLESWYLKYKKSFELSSINVFILSQKQLKAISLLKNPHDLLFTIKGASPSNEEIDPPDRVVLFDTIQDPGNFGTIIRTLSWLGITHIICSPESVSITNPKVIQASMGAFTLVNVLYLPLKEFIRANPQFHYYATDMKGLSIYEMKKLKEKQFGIIFGNEGKGISSELLPFVTETLSIPPKAEIHPESLNLSISVGIILSQLLQN